jgi:hypothetical protein
VDAGAAKPSATAEPSASESAAGRARIRAGASTSAEDNPLGGAPVNPTTVRVDLNVRGAWEVALSGQGERVVCRTLEEASRVAHRCAADRRPCELIVCDAYHRVVHHELVGAGGERRRCLPSKASALGS